MIEFTICLPYGGRACLRTLLFNGSCLSGVVLRRTARGPLRPGKLSDPKDTLHRRLPLPLFRSLLRIGGRLEASVLAAPYFAPVLTRKA